jgi:hypothetical protein
MDTSKLTGQQRQIRMNIRNAFLAETWDTMNRCLANYPDQFSKDCIREMMDEVACVVCKHMGVRGGSHTYDGSCLCEKA